MSTTPPPADVPIRPATSVLMLRDSAAGLEVFVQHRVNTMDFAAGVVVFPGGRVDPADHRAGEQAAADTSAAETYAAHRAAWANTWFADEPAGAETLVATAVREVGEESGALLTAAQLFPWANWVTPPGRVKRFDTYFYVANGAAIEAQHQTTEAHRSEWDSVEGILESYAQRRLKLMTPTLMLLQELTDFGSVDQVLGAARSRVVDPVRPKLPDGRDMLKPRE